MKINWKKSIVWIPAAIFCTILWGSAFPAIKSGYELFQVDTSSVFSIIVFAGARFTLAGVLTLVIGTVVLKSIPTVAKSERINILLLGLIQTTFHYALFYVAVSNTTGVNSSILSATSGFLAVLFAAWYYPNDRFTLSKGIGCVLGLLGIVLLNLGDGAISTSFRFTGEGFMILASCLSALGALMSKELVSKSYAFAVSGYQLLFGGVLLICIGWMGGGSITPVGFPAWGLLLYLACLSAAAFGIWTILLKYHALSKISIFKALIPVFGTALSVLFLGEPLHPFAVLSLLLIGSGIIILNQKK